jgi:phenylacetic acid degradation operon negative regulatory protein
MRDVGWTTTSPVVTTRLCSRFVPECGRLLPVHARSALFDLFGDHLRSRGGRAPVASLVRILAPLGVTAPAVRTAISRMVRQGWLTPVEVAGGRGYALTERARQRLDDAGARIYRTRDSGWKGAWDLLVLTSTPPRSARGRLRSALSFLGYAPLTDATWISPYRSPEVEAVLTAETAVASRFEAYDAEPAALARHVWDLEALGAAYATWHADARALVGDPERALGLAPLAGDERAFVVRSHLVHEWRKFLFSDPGLPVELLPAGWAGHEAAKFFAEEAARLLPAAARFVDRCLGPDAMSGDTR